MILVDTSVWVDHFRGLGGAGLAERLEDGDVVVHPWVVGELALGRLGPKRAEILLDLSLLPRAPVVDDREVRTLVEARALAGTGIGWVDAQLLASAIVSAARLWTRDRALSAVAERLGVAI